MSHDHSFLVIIVYISTFLGKALSQSCSNDNECKQVTCQSGYEPYCATILFGQCKCTKSTATWSPWGHWSTCSVTCGSSSGQRVRVRHCSHQSNAQSGCHGHNRQVSTCHSAGPCKVNGGWGSWLPWGSCSVTCGVGTKHRQRNCDNPVPAHSGDYCSGYPTDNALCHPPCPTTAATTVSTTTAQHGPLCPSCDETLTNCSWNTTCRSDETCMIRSYPGFKFTIHCSRIYDCDFIDKALGASAEIYCCPSRDCIRKYLGI